jgi:hypothetical protein
VDRGRGASRPAAPRLAAAVAAVALAAAGCSAAGPGADGGRAPAPPATAAPAATAPADADAPRFLAGRPLEGPTGLRLLVAADPPRLLDLDRGTSRPVRGLPAGQGPVGVTALGAGALITADPEVFVLARGSLRASRVGRAVQAVASPDGRGVRLLEHGRRCRLREVDLDGRDRRPPRRVPCATALLDPAAGRALARYPEVHGVVGDLVLWGDDEAGAGPFTLTDRGGGASRRVARPTRHGRAGQGRASPDGRLLAVEFADVSWSRVDGQVSDVWLLDLTTRRWRRLPGMPLITAVKFMSMEWTGDGRLVLAGQFDRVGDAVATWRPGQDHLAIRRLDLPEPDGSDSFVIWPSAGA